MAIGIRPTVDFAFKLVFGSPEHTRVTIHFLNAVLGGQPRITEVQILNPFLGGETLRDKVSVLDVLAMDEHGRRLNVEMQTTLPVGLAQRLTYYAAKLHSSQMLDAAAYSTLRPTICICVLTKSMFADIPDMHLDFRLREAKGRLLTDDLQIHLLELPKLMVTEENVESARAVEQWAYFLRNADQYTLGQITEMFRDPEFTEAAGVLDMISRTPEQQWEYDARMKYLCDQASILEESRLAKEGLQAAKEGLQAVKEGLEAAKEEQRAANERLQAVEKSLQAAKDAARAAEHKGRLAGRISLLQELLQLTEPTAAELALLTTDQLTQLGEILQQQLRRRVVD